MTCSAELCERALFRVRTRGLPRAFARRQAPGWLAPACLAFGAFCCASLRTALDGQVLVAANELSPAHVQERSANYAAGPGVRRA
jgi:hypothetical protein